MEEFYNRKKEGWHGNGYVSVGLSNYIVVNHNSNGFGGYQNC
jgi:hypothetical protein